MLLGTSRYEGMLHVPQGTLSAKRPYLPIKTNEVFFVVTVVGLEPTHYRQQRILSSPRLPIPTHSQAEKVILHIIL